MLLVERVPHMRLPVMQVCKFVSPVMTRQPKTTFCPIVTGTSHYIKFQSVGSCDGYSFDHLGHHLFAGAGGV